MLRPKLPTPALASPLTRRSVLLGMLGLPLLDTASVATAAPAGFPPVNGTWADPGPFPVTVEVGLETTVFRPSVLGENGLRHPVIVWGNGTGAIPGAYDALLRHFASHGFVVAAANTINAGTGIEMLDGASMLISENAKPGSAYYRKIDTAHIAATGHSQGGGGAIAAGADPRITTTVPIQPGPQGSIDALHAPMLILGGQDDTIVVPSILIIPRYNEASKIPAIYAELAGATHFETVGDGGGFRGPITAWFRFWLMGDEQARAEFFGPDAAVLHSKAWSDVRRNTLAQQIPG